MNKLKAVGKNRTIKNESYVENCLKAIHYENGIIEIIWDTKIHQIEVYHLKKMQEITKDLGGGKKMLLHFSMHEFLGISKEARNYASSYEGVKYTLATTVLVDNLAKKISFNFFMNVNKPIVLTKCFTTRDECFIWLENMNLILNSKI